MIFSLNITSLPGPIWKILLMNPFLTVTIHFSLEISSKNK